MLTVLVTLTKKSDDVFGMLNQLLKGTNFTYEMEGNHRHQASAKAKSQAHGKKNQGTWCSERRNWRASYRRYVMERVPPTMVL